MIEYDPFRGKLTDVGIDPGAELREGKLTRATCSCKPAKKGRDGNGWYLYHADEPATLTWGCWNSECLNAAGGTLTAKRDQDLTPAEREVVKARIEANRKAREEERQQTEKAVREESARLWASGHDVSADHAYIVNGGGFLPVGAKQVKDMLLVPMSSTGTGEPASLQRIYSDGSKRFLKGTGAIPGPLFFIIPGDDSKPLYMVEGWKTGCSVHEATGASAAVAFSSGRLLAVAAVLKKQFPDREIIVAGDTGNGSSKATEAARLIGCKVVFPKLAGDGTDFSDLFQEAGVDEVRRQLTTETAPQEQRGAWPPCIDMVKLSQERPYPPRFIIPGWLPAGYATLFAGHGGIGKSGLALMVAVCIALGLSFCGLPIQRKTVLYLSCEDREGVLHWRLLRICEYLGVSMADLNGWLHVVDLVGHEVILYNGTTSGRPLTPAYDELRNLISSQGAEVLFVDGIGDTYSGNENSRAEVKAFVNALLALIPPDDGAVVLVGHVAKLSANTRTAEGYSGSTAWHNSVRARWYLYPETNVFDGRAEKTGDLLLELQKSNLGAADLSLRFGWDDTAGLFINKESAPGQGQDQAADEQAELDGILAALRACTTYVPAARQGSHTAYHTLSVCPEFPPSLLQGTAGKKRFWRRIEQLARIRAIEESSIRRSDRKLTRVWVSVDAVCANSTIQLNKPCDNSQHTKVRELHNSQGGYRGSSDAHYPTNLYQMETEEIVPFVDVDLDLEQFISGGRG